MPGMSRSAAQNGTRHAASRTGLYSGQFRPLPGVPAGIMLTTHLGTATNSFSRSKGKNKSKKNRSKEIKKRNQFLDPS
jgi:hypothetical protein